jgi:putative transposase
VLWLVKKLQVARSGYYSWLQRQSNPGKRAKQDEEIAADIEVVFKTHRSRYGSPRKRVERLMKRQGIQALQRRRFRCCPKQEEGNKIATNILLRKFNPTAPNLYWCGDITYIRTTEGWRYLAVWMDLYSRRIIGWKIGSNMEAELVTKALNRALILRRINPSKLVIHTDQGSQYTGSKYQKLLIENKINCSMSRKGNCWDNAAMESFFSTYKLENNLDDNSKILLTPLQLQSETTSWIEEYYNLNRRHSSNDYLSPIDYENRALKSSIINEQAS